MTYNFKIYKEIFFVFMMLQIIFSKSIFAQNVGYLRKKYTIGCETSVGTLTYGLENGISPPILKYSLFAERTISKNYQIRISTKYIDSKMPSFYAFMIEPSNGQEFYLLDNNVRIPIKVVGYNISLYKFTDDFVAPMGFYHKINLGYYKLWSEFKIADEYLIIKKENIILTEPNIYNSKAIILSYGFGRKYIVANTIVLDLGLEFSINLISMESESYDNTFETNFSNKYAFNTTKNLAMQYKYLSNGIINRGNLIKLIFGIGYIF